jgi:hypothetical protein
LDEVVVHQVGDGEGAGGENGGGRAQVRHGVTIASTPETPLIVH